jgi:[ribosomal protein S5]-alanine N-acetyltransferase
MTEPPGIPVLHTSRLILRALVVADAADLHAAYGDVEAMRFWDSLPSRDEAETVARIRQSVDASPQWHAAFAVLRRETGQCVGMVNYHWRQPWNRRLAIGWILARPWWRQGFGSEATDALLGHCFTALDTHRAEAHIEPGNTASIRLAERFGFRREGLMRDWMFVADQPRDMVLYALLRPDWNQSK